METPTFIETYDTQAYDLCDRIVERLEAYIDAKDNPENQMHYMNGEKMHDGAQQRKDHSFNFTSLNDPLIIEIHDLLRQYLPLYADKYDGFSMQPCISQAVKVQKTPPKGGFHTWHAEHASGDDSPNRNLVWTFYLNDIPEGEGETEFLEYGMKVQPKKGALCIFPAAWTHTHRGNPVYSCDKYIATGWYYLI